MVVLSNYSPLNSFYVALLSSIVSSSIISISIDYYFIFYFFFTFATHRLNPLHCEQTMGLRSFLSRKMRTRLKSKSKSNEDVNESLGSRSSSSTNSRSQIEDLEIVFRRFDVNGDGMISWSELGAIMSSLGQSTSEEELRRMVKEVDSDGDGFIDLHEFIELNTNEVDAAKIMEDLRNAFLIYDLDRNGSISPDELQQVLKSLGDDTSIEECKKMISGVDFDGDGSINFDEFKVMMMGSSQTQPTVEIVDAHTPVAIGEE